MKNKLKKLFNKYNAHIIIFSAILVSLFLITWYIMFFLNDNKKSYNNIPSTNDTIEVDSVMNIDTILLSNNNINNKKEIINKKENKTIIQIDTTEEKIVTSLNDSLTNIQKKKDTHIIKVSVTCYQPVKEQCYGNPLITADGSHINLQDLYNNKIKWCAVSPDIIKKYYSTHKKGQPKYIHIQGFGTYEIHDRTSARFTNRIDILIHPQHKVFGKKNNVTATIIK